MKYLFLILSTILFSSCSESSSSEDDLSSGNKRESITSVVSSPFKDKYFFQQWYINKDLKFYYNNDIYANAHINPSDILKTYSGKGIKIAVIDSGLDIYHEDLENAIVKSYSMVNDTSNVSPDYGGNHGTSVTGIIAARSNNIGIKGIASDSEIFFLKYKDVMSDEDTIEIFNKAAEWGADIINCSWGTGTVSEVVKETIIDLAKKGRNGKGISIVFSSGNKDESIIGDESNINEVISVGASNKFNQRADYSNFGENLDVLAPGGKYVGITSLDIMGPIGKGKKDLNYLLADSAEGFIGTSASTPIVSGVIALMLEKEPSLSRIEIENILKNTADKIGNLEYYKGRNDYYGYGKINLNNIMISIEK